MSLGFFVKQRTVPHFFALFFWARFSCCGSVAATARACLSPMAAPCALFVLGLCAPLSSPSTCPVSDEQEFSRRERERERKKRMDKKKSHKRMDGAAANTKTAHFLFPCDFLFSFIFSVGFGGMAFGLRQTALSVGFFFLDNVRGAAGLAPSPLRHGITVQRRPVPAGPGRPPDGP